MTLKTSVLGLDFANPLVLASGILGTSSPILIRMGQSGAGAVTMKSIGPAPREGHVNPNMVDFGAGMLNAIGLPGPGYMNIREEMEELKNSPVPVFASIYGTTVEDYVTISENLLPFKPAAIELDISCPNKDDGMSFSANPDIAMSLVSAVSNSVHGQLPLIIKLTPNTHSIPRLAEACAKGGADALCLINTASAMLINIEARRPVLHYKKGGMSGPALKPIAVRCVYEAYQSTGLPIIGTGGVTSGRDAIEMLMAGASLVGIGTAVYYRGMNVFREIADEMAHWMQSNDVQKPSDLVGAAHHD